ncbi:E3 ubiquitin/ISG15 ligase TRIM25-like [Phyllobates terribilis]|uniref:E3 ubiquitin/ISG15 ligase TRIM25-like n=1 Tax=Phyllobates terribilis TaxID=111132 RepID=UPI003CCB116D
MTISGQHVNDRDPTHKVRGLRSKVLPIKKSLLAIKHSSTYNVIPLDEVSLCGDTCWAALSLASLSLDTDAMASAGLEKVLDCSICLTLYTDPVTLRCGHNFCRACINQFLDTQDWPGVYTCPECREEFQERPALMKNITLCNVVENFWSNRGNDASIRCTYCIDSSVPAVISCLLCEAFLCDNHLKDHSKEEHVLPDPSSSLENRKCSVHKKILEYYCTEDAVSICVSCHLTGEHMGHQVEMLDEASEKKKMMNLSNVQQKVIRKRKQTEERVQSLEELGRNVQEKVAVESKRVTTLFIDIRRRVDALENRVLLDISRLEEKVSLSHVFQKLEIKKDQLSRKMRHIEERCNMTDPLTVLQKPDTSDFRDSDEDGCDEATGGHDGDDLTTATWTLMYQYRPETAERFQYNQVMSGTGFYSGRHYWDVEISGSRRWRLGMCYPSIDRSGIHSLIGYNNKSWRLCGNLLLSTQYSLKHDGTEILLRHQISSNRVRIYLDYDAGLLSFYELCKPIRLLHTFTAEFTEPLHAVLCLYEGSIRITGSSR